ncbi:energy transducer TonB [Flavobacterium chungbukense]|uniref:Energy transducer TonB n=1 Tax=Flavobacterium chungbukense TaxID=877464 RepID=A0ABP7YQL8_9FLAO|nr:energy transducer TonB [Flavobacterium chungbukense]MCC4923454.1 energy transducer TonB [Flavobacterium chungbukense]
MSKLSIYESKWTDLVFENKNKEYGAYQLRQESSKNSVTALFMGLLLIAVIGSASVLINKLRPSVSDPTIETPPSYEDPMTVVNVDPNVAPPPPAPPTPIMEQSAASATEAIQLTNPVVATTENAVENIAPNTENAPASVNATGNGTAVNAMPTTGGGGNGDVASVAPPTNDPVSSAILDKVPEFPGGIAQFYKYVGNNFRRPDLDMEKTLKVYVFFIVEKDGSLTDITVKNDPGYGMGKEAIRVLKSLKTKWNPGILDGKPVRTAYSLPITVKTEME